jgi:hypothetical protein
MWSIKIKQYLGTEFSAYECMLLFGKESYLQILKEIAKLDSIESIESAQSIDFTKLDKNDVYTLIHFADIAIEIHLKTIKNKKPNQERQNSFDKAYGRLLKILQNNPYLFQSGDLNKWTGLLAKNQERALLLHFDLAVATIPTLEAPWIFAPPFSTKSTSF